MFARTKALKIRPIDVDIFVHPQHDPACARRGVTFLSRFSGRYEFCMLMFDHHGSGREDETAEDMEASIDQEFSRSAWGRRAKSIVLSPELEIWVWGASSNLERIIGWDSKQVSLPRWLRDQGWTEEGIGKPIRPKQAFEKVLREARTPRSSSLYQQLAETMSLSRCTDRAFLEFKTTLQNWFPPIGDGRLGAMADRARILGDITAPSTDLVDWQVDEY